MAYIYQADVYCDDCGKQICRRLKREGLAPAPYGNVTFFMRSVKWLAQTKEPIQIPPVDLDRRMLDRLQDNESAKVALFWTLVFGLPLALLLVGGVVWLFRRA